MQLVNASVDTLLVVDILMHNFDRCQVSVHVVLNHRIVLLLEASKLPRMTGPLDDLHELADVTVQVLS